MFTFILSAKLNVKKKKKHELIIQFLMIKKLPEPSHLI